MFHFLGCLNCSLQLENKFMEKYFSIFAYLSAMYWLGIQFGENPIQKMFIPNFSQIVTKYIAE